MLRRSPHFGVLSSEEALFKPTVHGERYEGHQPPVLQQSERSQERVAERLPVPTELTDLLPVNVVQKHCHDQYSEQTHTCRTKKNRHD